MDVTFKKGKETQVVKYGPTMFPVVFLIPFIGFLVALVMWFKRGQHKEFFSQIMILMGIIFFNTFCAVVLVNIIPTMGTGLYFVSFFGLFVMYIYLMGSSVKNANMWRMKSLLVLGYKCENKEIEKQILLYKAPKWLFFKNF